MRDDVPRRLGIVGSAQVGCVAVVGGGVIGLSTALELVDHVQRCVLIDPAPGRGSSWAAAGMLSPAAEVAPGEEGLVSDLREAASMWPSFARRVEADSGLSVDYSKPGALMVGVTRSDARDAARVARQIVDAGIEAEMLDGDAAFELEPTLSAGISGAWLLPGDHHVDNRLLVVALLGAIKARGAEIVEDRCVSIHPEDAGVRLLLEHQGELRVDRCVLATGAESPPDGTGGLGIRPVRPVRGITLRLTSPVGVTLPTRTVRAIVDGVHCYLVPRSDRSLVVGATSEEQADPNVARAGGVFQLLDAGRRVFPLLDELHLAEVSVGLRPATTDHVPFVAALQDPRIVAALGHYRNGILLAPLAASRVAGLVLGST